ncbi:MAG: hypothetical protein ACTHK1_04235 [Actinomycetales bacterium]
MTTHRAHFRFRRARLALGSAAGVALLAATPAAHADPGAVRISAAGAPVSCDLSLTGASGYLQQRETSRLDGQGRAHVLFTITAHNVVLVDGEGREYRLVGSGHDVVRYATSDLRGDITGEQESFDFTVVGERGPVGVVRLHLRLGADGVPRVTDDSTCTLPNMS